MVVVCLFFLSNKQHTGNADRNCTGGAQAVDAFIEAVCTQDNRKNQKNQSTQIFYQS